MKILRKKIEKWNKEYYFDSNPSVSDEVYDFHYQELKDLEEKHGNLLESNSQTAKIGFLAKNPLFVKVEHEYKMYSINNAFSFNDLEKFFERVDKVTHQKNSYMIQPKIDGLSLSLVFKKNKFFYGATRGNGIIGENITQNILAIPQFKKLLDSRFFVENFELRGEAFISKKDFHSINQKITEKRKQNLIDFFETFNKKCQEKAKLMNLNWTKLSNNLDPDSLASNNSIDDWLFHIGSSKQNCNLKFKIFSQNHQQLIFFCDWVLKINKNAKSKIYQEQTRWVAELTLFLRFNHQLYMNPRNLTSGTLRQLNSKIVSERNIQAVFYDVFLPNQISTTMKQKMKIIQKLKFLTPAKTFFSSQRSELKKRIQEMTNERDSLPYETDGVVIKVNEEKYYQDLGHTEKFQHNVIAYKFPALKISTKINNIFPTVGRTGKITYNAELEPVFLSGTTISAANLHNPDFIKNLDLRIGDMVIIQKAGDVIPQVIKVLINEREKDVVKWEPVQHCPSCKKKLIQPPKSAFQFCLNDQCHEKKIQSLIYFSSLKGINIEGLSEAKIRFLERNNFVHQPFDFFQLKNHKEDLLTIATQDNLNIFGPKSIQNLLDEIEKSRNFSWFQLISSSNILHVGEGVAQIIASHFRTLEVLQKASLDDLKSIAQIGPVVALSVFNFFKNPFHNEMFKNIYNISKTTKTLTDQTKKISAVNSFWFGKIIVITGKLDQPRRLVIEVLLNLGGKVRKNISTKVDVCIVGKEPSSKLTKAQKLRIEIIYLTKITEIINFEKP